MVIFQQSSFNENIYSCKLGFQFVCVDIIIYFRKEVSLLSSPSTFRNLLECAEEMSSFLDIRVLFGFFLSF